MGAQMQNKRGEWVPDIPLPKHRRIGDMAVVTSCKRGHELTNENLYIAPSGLRVCRTCRLIAKDRYRATDKGKAAEIRAHHHNKELRPEKQKARLVVNSAIRTGKLIKPASCSINNDCWGRIEAHHQDYSKPLEVTWLCMGHHRKVHQNERTQ
jgi:hypothetical protein